MAKIESHKKFWGDVENTLEVAIKFRKVLSKCPGIPEFLINPNGSFTESNNETSEIQANEESEA